MSDKLLGQGGGLKLKVPFGDCYLKGLALLFFVIGDCYFGDCLILFNPIWGFLKGFLGCQSTGVLTNSQVSKSP